MTIHCAISYLDESSNHWGLLLGIDSVVDMRELSISIYPYPSISFKIPRFLSKLVMGSVSPQSYKTTYGEDFAVLIAGSKTKSLIEVLRGIKPIRQGELEEIMNELQDGTDFSNVEPFRGDDRYWSLIMKSHDGYVDLYEVSNVRSDASEANKALLARRLPIEGIGLSEMWYLPIRQRNRFLSLSEICGHKLEDTTLTIDGYLLFKFEQALSRDSAVQLINQMLSNPDITQTYTGTPVIYDATQGIVTKL